MAVNVNQNHFVGGQSTNVANAYFDGYLTEINFVDGQQLTPSSFGETDSITGVWKPKAYSGTYGTNGFELNFSDNSNNTAATIGKDYSGNGNNWTPNNISVTTGVTYDSMQDVPTLTSATAANYCVLNPLNPNSGTISNGNLNQLFASASYQTAIGTLAMSSGSWYCEVTCTAIGGTGDGVIGIAATQPSSTFVGNTATSYGWYSKGFTLNNGASVSYNGGATWTTNDVIGIAFNATSGSLEFYKNGTSQGVAYSGIPAGNYFIGVSSYSSTTYAANFGQRPFSYTPPTGFVALNTYNLPASTITNGAAYMAATTYTGTGATQSISNAVNGISMQPDWVWFKRRGAAENHWLTDSVRGSTKGLFSNLTDAEATRTDQLTSFNSNGFSLGADAAGYSNINGQSYIAWQWKAGGTSASNTNGTITSTVSVGATQGFSVVTYTGTGVTATVGHGLGVAPRMIIVKNRAAAESWRVGHSSMNNGSSPWSYYMNLNGTGAQVLESAIWNNTAPTSTVFTISNDSAVSGNGQSHVAYCFAAVAGYSAFGSYTGNGSTDGPFIYTGFRPRFVMWKRTDSTASWFLEDSSRGTYNVMGPELFANNSDAEGTVNRVDFLSNGFKLRAANAGDNASGGTFIYMAFAESPFKTSLAR
jgi:hypothetical protein